MFENFEEISKLEIAIKTCQDLEKDIQSTIKHITRLNKKYNPLCKRYFLNCENYFETEEEVEEENNLSTNKLFDPSEIQEMKEEKRLLKEIVQGYSKINTKLIKIQRNVESISTDIKLHIKSENKKKSIFVLDHYRCSHRYRKNLS